MKEISVSELKQKIENKETMLVSFSASWCGPCKMMKPTFERLTNENTTEVVNSLKQIEKLLIEVFAYFYY
jgi:thioredoxin 1